MTMNAAKTPAYVRPARARTIRRVVAVAADMRLKRGAGRSSSPPPFEGSPSARGRRDVDSDAEWPQPVAERIAVRAERLRRAEYEERTVAEARHREEDAGCLCSRVHRNQVTRHVVQ